MPEIPDFQAQPVAIPEARRSYVYPEALAEPGRALERTGQQLGQLGDALGRIKDFQDRQYVAAQSADATIGGHDKLQNGIDEARKTGNYDGFAANLRQSLDQDLQQRLDNAPSAAAQAELKGHFATLTDEISTRASLAEHGMAVQDHEAQRATAAQGYETQVYRDPTTFQARYADGMARIAADARAGLLNPEQRQKEEKALGASLGGAAIEGRTQYDPVGTARDLENGRYDPYLSPGQIEQLQPRLGAAIGKAVGRQGGGGTLVGPQPGASDQDADAALAPIIQRESGGNANIGFGGTDLTDAPRDPTGFPVWQGAMGPQGISHAAGMYQIGPGTWRPIAQKLGITDFSPASQTAVARELYREQGTQPWAASAGQERLSQKFQQIDALNLSPAADAAAKDAAQREHSAMMTDEQRDVRLQAQQQKQASDAAENKVIADAKSDHPQITAQQIANDPSLSPDAKLRMITFVGRDGQVDPGLSHQTAVKLMRGIGAGTVTDRAPIIDAFNQGNLNWTDFDHVSKQVDDLRTAGGEVLAKRKADFIKSVAPQIDPKGALGGLDPTAQQKLYQFEYTLDEKIDEYRKAGKNPSDLLDPSKPDFMGKPDALKPFASPLIQKLNDAATPAAAGADLTTKDGIVAAYKAGTISRDDAAAALVKGGFADAPTPAADAPQVPMAR